MSSKHCITLAEFREKVLALSQAEVAAHAKCRQAWVSQVERGHLPKRRNRARILKAYGLESPAGEREFERMVLAARQLLAMGRPIIRDLPLWMYAKGDQPAEVTDINAKPEGRKQA